MTQLLADHSGNTWRRVNMADVVNQHLTQGARTVACVRPALVSCRRENMTDVVIQHLTTEQKVRIKCRDYVRKLAIYRDTLAVQLPQRVIIYELEPGAAAGDMHYKVATRIMQQLDCNLLVVTAKHITLCQVSNGPMQSCT